MQTTTENVTLMLLLIMIAPLHRKQTKKTKISQFNAIYCQIYSAFKLSQSLSMFAECLVNVQSNSSLVNNMYNI